MISNYYLVVGKLAATRSHKLSDCSGNIEIAEHQAVEVFKELCRRGQQDRIVRVVEEGTRTVQFAVHAGNIGPLGG